jgi:hypothetical protein
MSEFDTATWQALGLALTLVGLGISAVVWARKGALSGLRAVAWSLLPLAAGLTGLLRLGWTVADAIGNWAVRLVFSPAVWLGVAIASVSVVLFVVTGFAKRRAQGRAGTPQDRPKVAKPAQPAALPPDRAPAATTDDDLADIEAILRKHGIT